MSSYRLHSKAWQAKPHAFGRLGRYQEREDPGTLHDPPQSECQCRVWNAILLMQLKRWETAYHCRSVYLLSTESFRVLSALRPSMLPKIYTSLANHESFRSAKSGWCSEVRRERTSEWVPSRLPNVEFGRCRKIACMVLRGIPSRSHDLRRSHRDATRTSWKHVRGYGSASGDMIGHTSCTDWRLMKC